MVIIMMNTFTVTDVLLMETGIGFSAGPSVAKTTLGTVVLAKTADVFNRVFGIELKTNFVKNFLATDVTTFENFENTLKAMVTGQATICNADYDFNTEYERLRLELFKVISEDDEELIKWQYHANTIDEVKAFVNKCIERVKLAVSKNVTLLKGTLPITQQAVVNNEVKKEVVNKEQPLQQQAQQQPKEVSKETEQVSKIMQQATKIKEVEQPKQETVKEQPKVEQQPKQEAPVVNQQAQQQPVQIPIFPAPINTDNDLTAHGLNLVRFILENFHAAAIPYENGFVYPCNTTSQNVFGLGSHVIPGGRLIDLYPIYTCSLETYNMLRTGNMFPQQPVQQPLMMVKPEDVATETPMMQRPLISGPIRNNTTGELKLNILPTERKEMTVNEVIQQNVQQPQQQATQPQQQATQNTDLFKSIEARSYTTITTNDVNCNNVDQFEKQILHVIAETKAITNSHFCYSLANYIDENNFTLLNIIVLNNDTYIVDVPTHPRYLCAQVSNGNISIIQSNASEEDKKFYSLERKFINFKEVAETEADLDVIAELYNRISQSHELCGNIYKVFPITDGNVKEDGTTNKPQYYAISCGLNGEVNYNVVLRVNVSGGQFVIDLLSKEEALKLSEIFKANGLI